jgi:lipoprotein-releasing system permease protein
MPNWQAAEKEAFRNPAVRGAAPFVETQGLLVRDDVMKPSVIRGILPEEEHKVSDVGRQVRQGSLQNLRPGEFNIVLGYVLARSLGVGIGDKVNMMLAQGRPRRPAWCRARAASPWSASSRPATTNSIRRWPSST